MTACVCGPSYQEAEDYEFKVSQGYLKDFIINFIIKDFIKPKTNNYVNSLNADPHEVNK